MVLKPEIHCFGIKLKTTDTAVTTKHVCPIIFKTGCNIFPNLNKFYDSGIFLDSQNFETLLVL